MRCVQCQFDCCNFCSDKTSRFGGSSQVEPVFNQLVYKINVDATRIISFACTLDATFLLLTGKKEIVSNDPENQNAVGLTHFYQEDNPDKVMDKKGTKAKVWKFLTEEQYEERKDSIPGLCFATRHRIQGLAEALSRIHDETATDEDWRYSGLPDLSQVLIDD